MGSGSGSDIGAGSKTAGSGVSAKAGSIGGTSSGLTNDTGSRISSSSVMGGSACPSDADSVAAMTSEIDRATTWVHVEFYITAWDEVTGPFYEGHGDVTYTVTFDSYGDKVEISAPEAVSAKVDASMTLSVVWTGTATNRVFLASEAAHAPRVPG